MDYDYGEELEESLKREKKLEADLTEAKEERDKLMNSALYHENKRLKKKNERLADTADRLLDEIGKLPNTVATYNRGYVNGYKNASKLSPNFCQVCGIKFIDGMEHSCQ